MRAPGVVLLEGVHNAVKRGRKPKLCPVSAAELIAEWFADPRLTPLVVKYGAGRRSVISWLRDAGIEVETKRRVERPYKRIATRSSDGKRISCTLYNIWHSMRLRCLTKGYRDYKYYGGRGVTVCAEWKDSYDAFRAWAVSSGFRKGLTIDRTHNDAGYGPHNCVWATMAEQCLNKSSTVMVDFRGERLPLFVLADRFGLNKEIVRARVRMQGWSVERALTTPCNSRR